MIFLKQMVFYQRILGFVLALTLFFALGASLVRAHMSPSLFFSGCGGQMVTPTNLTFEQEVVELTNQARSREGLSPLRSNPDLAFAARYHSADMHQDDYFDHDSFDRQGGSLSYVCSTWERIETFYPDGGGENIAVGYRSPQDVVDGWLSSPGHRRNIMGNFTEIGVGFHEFYWTQNFGRGTGPLPTNTPMPAPPTPTATPTPVGQPTSVPPQPTTVPPGEPPAQTSSYFEDDFESNKGWITNPYNLDSATAGQLVLSNPSGTSKDGYAFQLGETASGEMALVTGPQSGSRVGSHDVDDGKTTIISPPVQLPNNTSVELSFSYYFSHWTNAGSEDFLRVNVYGDTYESAFSVSGSERVREASWNTRTVNLDRFAGQTIYLIIEVADNGSPSLIEAAVDDVKIAGSSLRMVDEFAQINSAALQLSSTAISETSEILDQNFYLPIISTGNVDVLESNAENGVSSFE